MEINGTGALTKVQRALFALLRAGLWERPLDDEAVFPLSDGEWRELYDLAGKQTVIGIVFQGVCQLPEELFPPIDILTAWVARVDHIEHGNRAMMQRVDRLLALFEERGLHPVVQKGVGVAAMYERPLLRSSGDIDLWFPTREEDAAAMALITERGISVDPHHLAGGAVYWWEQTKVEYHHALLDIYSPLARRSVAALMRQEGLTSHFPSPLVTMLLLNTHLLKHIMASGVGLRQFADMARACYVLDGKYDKTVYTDLCRKWHITEWSAQLNAFLITYLGVPASILPSAACSSCVDAGILQKVLAGGSFGLYHDGNHWTKGRGAGSRRLYKLRHSLGDFRQSFRLAPTECIAYTFLQAVRQTRLLLSR